MLWIVIKHMYLYDILKLTIYVIFLFTHLQENLKAH